MKPFLEINAATIPVAEQFAPACYCGQMIQSCHCECGRVNHEFHRTRHHCEWCYATWESCVGCDEYHVHHELGCPMDSEPTLAQEGWMPPYIIHKISQDVLDMLRHEEHIKFQSRRDGYMVAVYTRPEASATLLGRLHALAASS